MSRIHRGALDSALKFLGYTKPALYQVVQKAGFNRAMEIRREMQVCLAGAAQKGPQSGRLPMFAQGDMVQRIKWIEKWCRLYYLRLRMKELLRQNPEMTQNQRKGMARLEWEKIILPEWSY